MQNSDFNPHTLNGYPVIVGKSYFYEDINKSGESALVRVTKLDHEEGLIICERFDTSASNRILKLVPEEMIDAAPSISIIKSLARDLFGCDGELEIDADNAVIPINESVYAIECWVWVPDNDTAQIAGSDYSEEDLKALYISGAHNISTDAEIRDDARVSNGNDNGAYVSGWVTFTPDSLELIEVEPAEFVKRQPESQSRVTVLDAPEFYRDAAFAEWLNNPKTMVFTWHVKGEPMNECSDVLVKIDGSCSGEGDVADDMPAHIWNLLVDYCREQLGIMQGNYHYLLLRNIEF